MANMLFHYRNQVDAGTVYLYSSQLASLPVTNIQQDILAKPWKTDGPFTVWSGNLYVPFTDTATTTVFVATIPAGVYTGSGLASVVKSAMNSVGDFSNTNVTYNSTTQKFVFSRPSGTLRLLFNSDIYRTRSMAYILGFERFTDYTGSLAYSGTATLGNEHELIIEFTSTQTVSAILLAGHEFGSSGNVRFRLARRTASIFSGLWSVNDDSLNVLDAEDWLGDPYHYFDSLTQSASNTVNSSTVKAYTGAQSYRFLFAGTSLYCRGELSTPSQETGDLYIQIKVYIDSWSAGSEAKLIALHRKENGTMGSQMMCLSLCRRGNGYAGYRLYVWSEGDVLACDHAAEDKIAFGGWHTIELYYKVNATAGGAAVYIDKVLDDEDFSLNTSAGPPTGWVCVGFAGTATAPLAGDKFYVDEIRVSRTYIGDLAYSGTIPYTAAIMGKVFTATLAKALQLHIYDRSLSATTLGRLFAGAYGQFQFRNTADVDATWLQKKRLNRTTISLSQGGSAWFDRKPSLHEYTIPVDPKDPYYNSSTVEFLDSLLEWVQTHRCFFIQFKSSDVASTVYGYLTGDFTERRQSITPVTDIADLVFREQK